MSRHLSPRYDQVILISGYPVLTAVNWSEHWCTMCVQYQSSCAPKLAKVNTGFPVVRTDGRAVYGHVITKFSGMGRFTYPWCSAGALRAPELRYKKGKSPTKDGTDEQSSRSWRQPAIVSFENLLAVSLTVFQSSFSLLVWISSDNFESLLLPQ